jgi:hypothetical protein
MANHVVLKDISPGDGITAQYLTKTTRAVNEMSRAIRAPREVLQPLEELTGNQSSEGETVGDETFACTVTESTQTVTDSNGDTIDIERVDTVTCTESTSGRTMTLNITYP